MMTDKERAYIAELEQQLTAGRIEREIMRKGRMEECEELRKQLNAALAQLEKAKSCT